MLLETRHALEAIAAKHGFTLDDLRGKGRFVPHVRARQECYEYLAGKNWNAKQISLAFNRDRATIVLALLPSEKREQQLARYRNYQHAKKRDPWAEPLGAKQAGA